MSHADFMDVLSMILSKPAAFVKSRVSNWFTKVSSMALLSHVIMGLDLIEQILCLSLLSTEDIMLGRLASNWNNGGSALGNSFCNPGRHSKVAS